MKQATLRQQRSSQALAAGTDAPASAGLRPRLLPLGLSGLALAGLGISAYLALTHYANRSIVCAGLGECDYVNSSEYASVIGIPVSVLGLLMYAGLLAVSLAWVVRYRSEVLPVAYWGMALGGAGYAGYLTYVELGILHAICVWCVASATVLAASLVVSTAGLLRGG